MNLLSDVITYVRRIIKSPSNTSVSDNLIVDYINRFWLMDVDARLQLFDLRSSYKFQTTPGVNQYNMPLYGVNGYASQPSSGTLQSSIASYPVYQGFMGPAYVNGIQVPFYTERNTFLSSWPTYTQQLNSSLLGNGSATYSLTLPFSPSLRGHVDMAGIIASGSVVDPIVGASVNTAVPKTSVFPAIYITSVDANGKVVVASDSGQFLSSNNNLGLLTGDVISSWGATQNVVNYNTGAINVTFNTNIPSGTPINLQCFYFAQGLPRSVLFYNNVITIMPPPNISYSVELDGYLTPAAFFSTAQALPFAYMAEYIARGAARKMLSDTGDQEQFGFYEPLFREQEMLVWKRAQRQVTATRTQTIYSSPSSPSFGYNIGQGT